MQLVHAGKGRIPTRIGAGIMRDALTGLHAAHEVTDERGVMLNLDHRDVSPQNILVGADGVARVLDFGIAKASSRSQKTRDGQVKGKLSYMAPEQLGGEATRVSDVFAACIVLWEVLTGERLFRGATEQETVMRVIAAPIARPSERAPELGTVFDEIVMKGLERDPARRFQTAREVAVALDDVAELADAGEIAEWVGGIARELLAERARTVIDVETTAPHEVKSTPPRAPQPPVVSAEPTKTVLTSVVVGQPQPRSWLGVAAGGVLLVGVAVMGTILATRHDGPAAGASAVVDPSSQPSAIPPPTPSASSIAVATALSPTASTSATAAPGPSAPHPRGHVKPPRASSPTIPDHL
jgi:serine/threonine-protein kinase